MWVEGQADLTGGKFVRELWRSSKEAERECHIKTRIQDPKIPATDETRIKHR